jgi:hypothetical protein
MPALPLAFLLLTSPAPALGPGKHARTVEVGGVKRTYHVHVPRRLTRHRACPLARDGRFVVSPPGTITDLLAAGRKGASRRAGPGRQPASHI